MRVVCTLILAESVRNMHNLSIPRPQPPVGGRPYSRAVQKLLSTACACNRHGIKTAQDLVVVDSKAGQSMSQGLQCLHIMTLRLG